jgi:hypothetical protein
MDFRIAQLFLFFYYVRPQDWMPGLIGFNIIKPVIGAWLLALMTREDKSPLPGLVRTPHDWVMMAYFIYVGWTAPAPMDTFKAFLPLVAFYFLYVQSLNSWQRILDFLKWWNWMLIALALLAVLSLIGIDLTGARYMTGLNLDRLCLGTWQHCNPNALGHSVVAIIPLSYLLYFWEAPPLSRFVVFPLCVTIAGWCAWETESKGSFVVGALITLLAFVVGRPRLVQIPVIAASAILGVGALSFLPRMNDMNSLNSDEGVQGRLLAWQEAREVVQLYPNGMGWKQFAAWIQWREGRKVLTIQKSTHSAYVQIGADLGKYGLFLFVAAMWVAGRAVGFHKSLDEDEERCRRAILILLLAYVISGWMINREYHTEYFVLIALSAGLHRLRKRRELDAMAPALNVEDEESPIPGLSSPPPQPAWFLASSGFAAHSTPLPSEPAARIWNRISWIDVIVSIGLTWLVFRIWDHCLETML